MEGGGVVLEFMTMSLNLFNLTNILFNIRVDSIFHAKRVPLIKITFVPKWLVRQVLLRIGASSALLVHLCLEVT